MIVLKNKKCVETATGEIISENPYKPKFQNLTYEDYVIDLSLHNIEPMTCSEARIDDLPGEGWIAQEKLDGHRATCFVTSKGNRFFSRRISKQTNWYAENTDCLPHLRDFSALSSLAGTVFDGEITTPNGIFAEVQGITGALPETAINNQAEKGFAIYNVFDIIYYKGLNIRRWPLHKRLTLLKKIMDEYETENFVRVRNYAVNKIDKLQVDHLIYSFQDLLTKMWENGKEGLILKDLNGIYEGKRSKYFLKLKEIKTYDCIVMGFQPPTIWYDGKTLDEKGKWDYWADAEDESNVVIKTMSRGEAEEEGLLPVTKPWAMGWIGAIDVGVFKNGKLVKIAEVKGITDEDQEFIKKNRKKLINEQVIEVKAQGVIDPKTKSLRHPRFNRWRKDKSPEMCKWEDIN
jgi:ATP-dependent DNA ligase